MKISMYNLNDWLLAFKNLMLFKPVTDMGRGTEMAFGILAWCEIIIIIWGISEFINK